MDHICLLLDSELMGKSQDVQGHPAGPVLWERFPFLQPEDVARIFGEMKVTSCTFNPCSSWLILAARASQLDRLGDWSHYSILEVMI